MSKTLLVMAGGTGGHVFPGLAVADLLRRRNWKVIWMGTPDGMEAKLVPTRGYEVAWVRFAALRGKGLWRKLSLPLHLVSACCQAARQLRRIAPNVVLGMGGYVSFPGGLMAALFGYPLVIHEQNAVAGLANRVLARFASRIACGFPNALVRGEWLGNPVRPEIANCLPPATRLGDRTPPLRLLVLGGSQGASVLNDQVPRGLTAVDPDQRPQVIHQAGEKHLSALKANYAAAGVVAECVAFIDDMAAAYEWADLVICRAGALTVAELAAAGVASALVPLPHAVDDHQTANARFLTLAGGAMLLPQEQLTPEAIARLCRLPLHTLQEMATKARELARPLAAEAVATICEEVAQ